MPGRAPGTPIGLGPPDTPEGRRTSGGLCSGGQTVLIMEIKDGEGRIGATKG